MKNSYTEADAKSKWCPMVRNSHASAPRDTEVVVSNNEYAFCKGSGCMMWKWHNSIAAREAGRIEGFCGLVLYD